MSALRFVILFLCASGCGRLQYEPVGDGGPPRVDASGLELIGIRAGVFWMGCNQLVDGSCDADELPYRQVTLAAFDIERTEVSQSDYDSCVSAAACSLPTCNYTPGQTPDLPVVCVTWQQAHDFCQWRGRRLPSEAEWEKAARGDDGRIYPWGDQAPTCALSNYFGCPGDLLSVEAFPGTASPYGTINMAGNVWEWVNDFYGANYYGAAPASDPPGPTAGTDRVRRGGSYLNAEALLRVSNRWWEDPAAAPNNIGVRCAR